VLRDQTLDHPLWTDAEEVYVERCQFINPAKRPTDGSAAINLLWNGRGVKITVRDTTFKDWFMAIGGETILPGSAIERCHLRGCTNGFQFVNAPGITIKECSGQNYIDPTSMACLRRFENGQDLVLFQAPDAQILRNGFFGFHIGMGFVECDRLLVDSNVTSQDLDALDPEYRDTLIAQLKAAGVPDDQIGYQYDSLARGKGGGIFVRYSKGAQVIGNRLCRGAYGLELEAVQQSVVDGNTIMLMGVGIVLQPTPNIPVSDPDYRVQLGANYYGEPGGPGELGDDSVGQPRLVRRPRRVALSDHEGRLLTMADPLDAPLHPVPYYLYPPTPIMGEPGFTPPAEGFDL